MHKGMKGSKLESGVEIEKHSTDQVFTSKVPNSLLPSQSPSKSNTLASRLSSAHGFAHHPPRSLITLLNYHPFVLLTPRLFPFPLPVLPIFKSPRYSSQTQIPKRARQEKEKLVEDFVLLISVGSALIWEGPQANAPCAGCTDGAVGGLPGLCPSAQKSLAPRPGSKAS